MGAVKGKLKFNEFIVQYKKEIESELLALSTHLGGLIQRYAPVGANSHLGGSFEGKVVEYPRGIMVELGSPYEYGAYTEWGTKPHWAPIQPLIEWVEAKLQPHVLAIGVSFESGKAMPTRKGTKQLKGDKKTRAILALAHAVQYKIATKGTQGQFYMRKALMEMGLDFTEEPEKGRYHINVKGWLEPQIDKIIARATSGLQ